MPYRSSPAYIVKRRGRWHYHYLLDFVHRGEQCRRRVTVLSEAPYDKRASQELARAHRERTRRELMAVVDARLDAEDQAARPTVRRICAEWLAHARAEGRAVRNVAYMLDRISAGLGPDRAAADVAPADLSDWLDREAAIRHWKARTKQHYLTIAHGVWRHAIRGGRYPDLGANPADAVPRPRVARRSPPTYSTAQLQAILGALGPWEQAHHARPPRFLRVPLREMVIVAMSTGLRPSTWRRLRWEWLDLESETIRLPAAAMKTDGDHTIPLPPAVRSLLAPRWAASGYLWPNPRTGRPFGDIRAQWRQLLALANAALPPESQIPPSAALHHFRHTWATLMLSSGANLSHVAQWLGISEATLRRHYGTVLVDSLRESTATVQQQGPAAALRAGFNTDTTEKVM